MEGMFPIICIKPDDDSIHNARGVCQASADSGHQGYQQDDVPNVVNVDTTAEDEQLVTSGYGGLTANGTASEPITHQGTVKTSTDNKVGYEDPEGNIYTPETVTWVPQHKDEPGAPITWIAQPTMVTNNKSEELPLVMKSVEHEVKGATNEVMIPKQSKYDNDKQHDDNIDCFAKLDDRTNVKTDKICLRAERGAELLIEKEDSDRKEEYHAVWTSSSISEFDDSETHQTESATCTEFGVVQTATAEDNVGIQTDDDTGIRISDVRSCVQECTAGEKIADEQNTLQNCTEKTNRALEFKGETTRKRQRECLRNCYVLLERSDAAEQAVKVINQQETENRRFELGYNETKEQRGGRRKKKMHKCRVCEKCFESPSLLNIHMRIHTGTKPYKCEVCERYFTQLSTWTAHMRIHTGERPYKCLVCGKTCANSNTLARHRGTHTTERPYKCSVCGKSFSYNGYLTKHMQVHADKKPYECSVCGNSFAYVGNLTKHKRIHTAVKQYECVVCGKSFADICYLTRHTRIHTGEKPHKCSVCGKAFFDGHKLSSHMRVHTGEKPYECSVCGKFFTERKSVRIHKETQHNMLRKNTQRNST